MQEVSDRAAAVKVCSTTIRRIGSKRYAMPLSVTQEQDDISHEELEAITQKVRVDFTENSVPNEAEILAEIEAMNVSEN